MNYKALRIYISLLLLSFIGQINGQIIFETKTLKKGIYKTLEEFKNNNPSEELKYETTYKDRSPGIAQTRVRAYRINIDKRDGQFIGRVFGFCDGNSVFLCDGRRTLHKKLDFFKLQNLGRYSYLELRVAVSNYGGGPTSELQRRVVFLGGTQTFNIDVTYTSDVEDFLKDDPEIAKMYNEERKKTKNIGLYIVRYLEKHKGIVKAYAKIEK